MTTGLSTTRLPHGSVAVRLETDGAFGIGEASPLPDYSPDTIDEAHDALAGPQTLPAFDADRVTDWLDQLGHLASPAAQFALETAAFDLAGRLRQQPVRALLSSAVPPASIALNALVATEAEAARAFDRGIRTLKVKLGRNEFAEEYAFVRKLRATYPDVAIRLDANGAWPLERAAAYLEQLAELTIEYIEEPVASADMPRLTSPIRLAADESLSRLSTDALLANDSIDIFVLKPMLQGGLRRCLRLADAALAGGANVVVSHMFDGPIARAACAELSLALATKLACGLDAHAALPRWPALNVPQLTDNAIVPTDTVGLGVTGAEALWA